MSEYSYPFFNEEGKVLCQVCGKPYLVIAPKHLATHGIVYSEYKLRFPDAPLSCEEFDGLSKYGREKQIFVDETLSEMGEEVEVLEDPKIEEELDIEEIFIKDHIESSDIFHTAKNKILDHLRSFFTNIRKDYMIQIVAPDGRTLFETISDFADPILKIDVEFPKCFWHNEDAHIKPNRKITLEEYGWKIIEINSKAPTFDQIKKEVERT